MGFQSPFRDDDVSWIDVVVGLVTLGVMGIAVAWAMGWL